MQNREKPIAVTSPYPYSSSLFLNYLEGLMGLTYSYPTFMKYFVYMIGAASLGLLPSYWLLPSLGVSATAARLYSIAGGVGSLLSLFNGFMQRNIFGFPADDSPVYQEKKFSYGAAKGEILLKEKNMPFLKIEAQNHFDAGYVEGYILADAMQANLKQMNFLFDLVSPLLKLPKKDSELSYYLADVLKTIPKNYQEEMRGKVAGFNEWLKINNPKASALSFERYVLMQLLPDFKNYNPFVKKINSDLIPNLGCTTIAIRLGDYTFITRILDWPSYGMASKYFLQTQRSIAGVKSTIDLTHPLTSGAVTVVNENKLLIEINISDGDKIQVAEGMPSLFFNRYCAENASCVNEIKEIVNNKQPLAAYHMTTSDGVDTQSYHFNQNEHDKKGHFIETLRQDKTSPQLLVVTNQGLKFVNDQAIVTNHRDSAERKQNIHHFFHTHLKQELSTYIQKQEKEALSPSDILRIKEICLQIARLSLVNNCESVLCAMYVYYKGTLDACVATDNIYAPSKQLSEFKNLRY